MTEKGNLQKRRLNETLKSCNAGGRGKPKHVDQRRRGTEERRGRDRESEREREKRGREREREREGEGDEFGGRVNMSLKGSMYNFTRLLNIREPDI